MLTPAMRPGFKSAATEGNENFTCSVCKLETDLMCPCNTRLYYCSEVCQGKGWYDLGHAHECSVNPDCKRPHLNTSVVSSVTEDLLRQKSARICKEECISETLAPKNAHRVLDIVKHADTRYAISVATVPDARERRDANLCVEADTECVAEGSEIRTAWTPSNAPVTADSKVGAGSRSNCTQTVESQPPVHSYVMSTLASDTQPQITTKKIIVSDNIHTLANTTAQVESGKSDSKNLNTGALVDVTKVVGGEPRSILLRGDGAEPLKESVKPSRKKRMNKTCPIRNCDETFTKMEHVEEHLVECHDYPLSGTKTKQGKQYQCRNCPKTFGVSFHHARHETEFYSDKRCDVVGCEMELPGIRALNRHRLMVHRFCVCPWVGCGQLYMEGNWEVHLKEHHTVHPERCWYYRQCKYSCVLTGGGEWPPSTHYEECHEPIKTCPGCFAKMPSSSQLKKHKVTCGRYGA